MYGSHGLGSVRGRDESLVRVLLPSRLIRRGGARIPRPPSSAMRSRACLSLYTPGAAKGEGKES